ncbi:MAG: LolA-like outer membrane lipoprotein chaperone, partial [Campylobacterota bacterium]|nr:LolA-like outer membrane lipoprotein chaperone [Campylobacterota bacterium]
MKYLLFYLSLTLSVFASFEDIYSFQADFLQTVTDDKNKVLTYDGNISASKPQNALWNYKNPVNKSVYINSDSVTIVEPEIEQVIIKKLESSFNFFNMLKNSKKIKKDTY